jgi:hypothetical protein
MSGHLYAIFPINSFSNVILAYFSLSNMEDFWVKRFRNWANLEIGQSGEHIL